ncbi:hypothetical protein LCGC14_2995880 [marine sediment metagenome]|uniref:Uncharacterized protein n=1 Tax=marine sediment metagenome TaxID=412755 RepID=A0A0F8ZTL1_9ZZZZ
MEVKLVIDGEEIVLEPNGDSKRYNKFKEPPTNGEERSLMVTVYVAKDRKPKS